jgi:type I restriction enzyme M protein
MMLDLLRVGGRCAVVVPDGVLFGSTNAHIELRRKLLFENTLEGVVSLPGGVFNPYSGVKTSILVFKKVGDEPKAGRDPRTNEVWFYEVAEEAKTLDQRRNDRPGQNNDLYDASEKFHTWYEIVQGAELPSLREAAFSAKYHQPKNWKERWRVIDDEFLRIFPEEESQKGHALSLHEIFTDLPRELDNFVTAVSLEGTELLDELTLPFVRSSWEDAAKEKTKAKRQAKAEDELKSAIKRLSNEIMKLNKDYSFLDNEYDKFGLTSLKADLASAGAHRFAQLEAVTKGSLDPSVFVLAGDSGQLLERLLKCYARLDGYEIWLRSVSCVSHQQKPTTSNDAGPLSDVLVWVTPVRAWAKLESWKDPKSDKEVKKPTHDSNGLVDPAYVKWLIEECDSFNDDGTVKSDYLELLDPDCIEAADLNLSAGRHKPFVFSARQHNRPDDLIRKLDKVHEDIRKKLSALLSMVET